MTCHMTGVVVWQEAVGDKMPPRWKKKEKLSVTKSFHKYMEKVDKLTCIACVLLLMLLLLFSYKFFTLNFTLENMQYVYIYIYCCDDLQ